MVEPFTVKVKQAADTVVNGKAIGPDNICSKPLEFGRTKDSAIVKCLCNVVFTVWFQEIVLQEWVNTIIKVLFKKWDPHECGNYHGTSLGSHPVKVFLKIGATHLSAYCDWEGIRSAQYGIRPGRSTVDLIYIMCRLQKLATEKNLLLYMCFIDPPKGVRLS